MSILPGFQKYKRHIRIGDDYILDSEWTHAETVEMSDGSTLDDTVANINREITATKKSVSDGKSAVASAITAQGVTTAADATFNVMAANVGKVGTDKYNTGYNAGVAATKIGTATAAQVLSGKTFTNASTVGLTGTMTDYSANPQTVTLSSTQTGTSTLSLSAGYHSSVNVNAASVYSAGITAADARTNVNSANYQAGYNAGVAAGKASASGVMSIDASSGNTISMSPGGTGPGEPVTAYASALYFLTTTGTDQNKGVTIYLQNASGANGVTLNRDRWYTKAEILKAWQDQHGTTESKSFDFITLMDSNSTWAYARISSS